VLPGHHHLQPEVYYRGGVRLEGFDAIIPRIGASMTSYGTVLLRQFEMMGVYTLNGSLAITRSRDKLRARQMFSRSGLPMPVTAFARAPDDTEALIKLVGGAPLVIKFVEGTHGLGVLLAETEGSAESTISAMQALGGNILLQEFIAEAKGADLRCFVIGDRVVATIRRQARPGELHPPDARGTRHCGQGGPHARPECGRRGYPALRPGAVAPGSEFLARPAGNRGGDRQGYRRPDHPFHRDAGQAAQEAKRGIMGKGHARA
jgi:hypothetical protein